MKCFKCHKEMGREDGGPTLVLGKYSNGAGECDVAICFECYIDGLFN